MPYETVWSFSTARFVVRLDLCQTAEHDGFVTFDSRVIVTRDDEIIGEDHLGDSEYHVDSVSSFWTAHRDSDPMDRNCTLMRAARGHNVVICNYFPSMVQQAIAAARKAVAS